MRRAWVPGRRQARKPSAVVGFFPDLCMMVIAWGGHEKKTINIDKNDDLRRIFVNIC
jgi:hypothetical protein